MSDLSVSDVFHQPLMQLVANANQQHRQYFSATSVQASSLLSIKTGGCPENCAYCPQSAHYQTDIVKTKLLDKETVIAAAKQAKAAGASRFCMGAAWREIKDGPEFDRVLGFVESVCELGLETCCTLGMLSKHQAQRLKQAGLHFYNHNIDTSPGYYKQIIQTRAFDDRLQTLQYVRDANIAVCTGGILGMGESEADRILFIEQLVQMQPQPESITINMLIPIEGTPLAKQPPISAFDVVRVIATLRLKAPQSMIRLSAGRLQLTDEAQFLCFFAGANSIFLGDTLLTADNPTASDDMQLLRKVGLQLEAACSI